MKDMKDIKDLIPSFEAKTDPFGRSSSVDYAYKRSERIVSAIYLVTNHVPETEPLRIRLRSLGHQLLDSVIGLANGFRAGEGSVLARVREGVTLVRLLQVAGFISGGNAQILAGALDELGQFLTSAGHSSLSDRLQLERADLMPIAAEAPQQPAAPRRIAIPRREPAQKRPPAAPGRTVQTEVHDERRTLIMDILRQSGPLGIKDITAQTPGVSEKTVQRELSALIQEGTVKKEGEKRWSTYALSR
ncbi:MAG TPA: hypothetical protein VFL98_03995 [Candidatus Paceibacterota bacterium]|nr:hypothetical protein [Candidatus Paceibacterota bacterium]